MWSALSEEEKKRYTDVTSKNREANEKGLKEWSVKAAAWDKRTWEVKEVWIKEGNGFEDFVKRKRDEDREWEEERVKRMKIE